MKKVLMIVTILLMCGCDNFKDINEETYLPPINEEIQNKITRESVLKTEALKIYGDFKINKDNVGYYGTPLANIIYQLNHKELFKGCDERNTIILFDIIDNEGVIETEAKLILNCDGETKTYVYHSFSDEEPYLVY